MTKVLNASSSVILAPSEAPPGRGKLIGVRGVIGVCGFIGSGKGSFADALTDSGLYRKVSFADHLKDVVALLYGWDRELLEGDTEDSRKWREEIDGRWDITPRSALQQVGVCMRDIDPDFWVTHLGSRVDMRDDINYVIPDTRFYNEFEMIRKAGGLIVEVVGGPRPEWWNEAIRINQLRKYGRSTSMNHMQVQNFSDKMNQETAKFNKNYPGVHISEWGWAGESIDVTINNDGTEEELAQLAMDIAKGDKTLT